MTGDLGVASPAMKAYGQRAGAAGERIAAIELWSAFDRVASVLPGGTAGGAAAGCELPADVPNWGRAISQQGGKVGSADDSYRANELTGSDLFAGVQAQGTGTVGG